MRDALSVHRVLLERGVEHEVVRLPRPLQSSDDLPEVLGLPATSCAVVRCYVVAPSRGRVAAGDRPGPVLHAVVVPAGRHPQPGALQAALRAEVVREATSAEISRATDCAARLVTAVGLSDAVPVVVDAALDTAGTVWTPTGENGTAVGLHAPDLPSVAGGRVVPLTATRVPVIDLTAHEVRAAAQRGRQRAPLDLDAVPARGPREGHGEAAPPRRRSRG